MKQIKNMKSDSKNYKLMVKMLLEAYLLNYKWIQFYTLYFQFYIL